MIKFMFISWTVLPFQKDLTIAENNFLVLRKTIHRSSNCGYNHIRYYSFLDVKGLQGHFLLLIAHLRKGDKRHTANGTEISACNLPRRGIYIKMIDAKEHKMAAPVWRRRNRNQKHVVWNLGKPPPFPFCRFLSTAFIFRNFHSCIRLSHFPGVSFSPAGVGFVDKGLLENAAMKNFDQYLFCFKKHVLISSGFQDYSLPIFRYLIEHVL